LRSTEGINHIRGNFSEVISLGEVTKYLKKGKSTLCLSTTAQACKTPTTNKYHDINKYILPLKHCIGFYKNKSMIHDFFVCCEKKQCFFYSKTKIDDLKPKDLEVRNVRKIEHYTNYPPTEIVITEPEQVEGLIKYFNKIYERF